MSHVMKKPVYAICEQQRRRSACASGGRCETYLVENAEDRFSRDSVQMISKCLIESSKPNN